MSYYTIMARLPDHSERRFDALSEEWTAPARGCGGTLSIAELAACLPYALDTAPSEDVSICPSSFMGQTAQASHMLMDELCAARLAARGLGIQARRARIRAREILALLTDHDYLAALAEQLAAEEVQ